MIPFQSAFSHTYGNDAMQGPSPIEASELESYSRPKAMSSRKPSEVLLENSNIRPDVARVAVLGYN